MTIKPHRKLKLPAPKRSPRFDPAFGRGLNRRPVESRSSACVRGGSIDLTTLYLTVEPVSGAGPRPLALIPRQTFTESLILAQDERWRRA